MYKEEIKPFKKKVKKFRIDFYGHMVVVKLHIGTKSK